MILDILRHTPPWVWALAAGLLLLGLSQLRERRLAPARLWVLPGVLLALGLWSLSQSFTPPWLALLVWTGAVVLSAAVARRLPPPAGLRVDADGRLVLPGSPLPLVIIGSVFLLRYSGGVALALHPAWRGSAVVAVSMAASYGAISGLLLGRAMATSRRAQALGAPGLVA